MVLKSRLKQQFYRSKVDMDMGPVKPFDNDILQWVVTNDREMFLVS